MGFLSDYFSAPSDEAAARAVGIDVDLREPPYDVLQMKNLIPDYHLVPVEVGTSVRLATAPGGESVTVQDQRTGQRILSSRSLSSGLNFT